MNDIAKSTGTDLVDPQAQRIVDFLGHIGLPTENIIAEQSERNIIGQNLPAYIASLPDEVKRERLAIFPNLSWAPDLVCSITHLMQFGMKLLSI